MADFTNTIDLLGDEVVANSIIDNSIIEFKDDVITSIGYYAFDGCESLTIIEIPNVTSLGGGAFNGCTGLTTFTFGVKAKSLANNVFKGCTNLTEINVPWAEGEVDYAPWGATDATINYNYTGE